MPKISNQVILSFDDVRSNLTVTCVTCKALPILQQTGDPNNVSAELRSVGINRLPEALLQHELQCLVRHQPGLAAAAAPSRGTAFADRQQGQEPSDLDDPEQFGGQRRMRRDHRCGGTTDLHAAEARFLLRSAASQLAMVEVDMFATSPLPMEVPGLPCGEQHLRNQISAQKREDRSLSFCSRSAFRSVDRDDKTTTTGRSAILSPTRVTKGAGARRVPELRGGAAGTGNFFSRATSRWNRTSLLTEIRQLSSASNTRRTASCWFSTSAHRVGEGDAGDEYPQDGALRHPGPF